ncbi:MAG: glycosyltransferase family 4 protein [Opitutaceae bacterium]|nr:glycosyltransferase family 4 protein [Opitutaceae bacterium]
MVFVNRYYWPDAPATAQLLTDLAEGLAGRGWKVTVIASHDGNAGTPVRESRHGVDVMRVRSLRWGRHDLIAKAGAYFTFTFSARRMLRRHLQANDWLVAMTDPPVLAPIAAAAARRAGARLVHWLQDIHPEIGLALSHSRLLALLSKPWVRRRDAAWQCAQACVAISRDMAALVGQHGLAPKQIRLIPNWASGGESLAPVPAEQNPLRRAWGLAGKFVVAYSGNLGRVHALEPVLAAAARLRNEAGLVFLFLGDGPRRPALEAQARAQGLTNVHFLPPQPQARLSESLSVGDVHLVTLQAGCERYVFPSKLYGILAVARPVVFVGPPHCELAEAVRHNGAGLTVDSSDPSALAAAVRDLMNDAPRCAAMGQAARCWSQATGGRRAALEAWETVLRIS